MSFDAGLPTFKDMMKKGSIAGKGIKPIDLGFRGSSINVKSGISINANIKPIRLTGDIDLNGKKKKAPKNGISGILTQKSAPSPLLVSKRDVEQTKRGLQELRKNLGSMVERMDENVRPTAEKIRNGIQKGRASQLSNVRDRDRFAFGLKKRPESVLAQREFEFFTLQDGVLRRKTFSDRELAESQRRLAEAQGELEMVTQVREVRI